MSVFFFYCLTRALVPLKGGFLSPFGLLNLVLMLLITYLGGGCLGGLFLLFLFCICVWVSSFTMCACVWE